MGEQVPPAVCWLIQPQWCSSVILSLPGASCPRCCLKAFARGILYEPLGTTPPSVLCPQNREVRPLAQDLSSRKGHSGSSPQPESHIYTRHCSTARQMSAFPNRQDLSFLGRRLGYNCQEQVFAGSFHAWEPFRN